MKKKSSDVAVEKLSVSLRGERGEEPPKFSGEKGEYRYQPIAEIRESSDGKRRLAPYSFVTITVTINGESYDAKDLWWNLYPVEEKPKHKVNVAARQPRMSVAWGESDTETDFVFPEGE